MNTPPIINPFINTTNDYIQYQLKDFAKKFQTCIPAMVKEVKSRDSVVVSPTVLQTDTNGLPIEWSDMTLTILTPYGNGVFMSFPLSVGDTGWIVGADLDTSKFKEGKLPAQQNIYIRHQYQYGFFVPDAINGYTISEDDKECFILSSLNGDTKITMHKNGNINIVAKGDVSVKNEGATNIESKGNLKIKAQNVIIESTDNKTKVDGIIIKDHIHSAGSLVAPNGAVTGNTGKAS